MTDLNCSNDLPYQGFLIDIDGVIYKGGKLIKGADKVIKQLKKSGKRIVFVSNNSSQSPNSYQRKMLGSGLKVKKEDFVLATVVAAEYILKEKPSAKVYVLGAEGLRRTIEKYGLETDEDAKSSDYVVIGNPFKRDGELRGGQDKKITEAVRSIISEGTPFIAVNMDARFPTTYGPVPATGSIVKAIMHATGKSPSLVAGKPNEEIIYVALERLGLMPGECAMIGDSKVDILAARNTGLDSILVKTGSANKEELKEDNILPDLTLESIRGLVGR